MSDELRERARRHAHNWLAQYACRNAHTLACDGLTDEFVEAMAETARDVRERAAKVCRQAEAQARENKERFKDIDVTHALWRTRMCQAVELADEILSLPLGTRDGKGVG